MSTNLNESALNKSQPTKPKKWSGAVRFFHWGGAILLILLWIMITLHESSDGSTYLMLHRAFGVCLLLWMIVRVIARVISQSPAPMPMPKWQVALSHLTHLALYVLLFAMPISGILMTWYGGRSIDMFGLFELPTMLVTDRPQARFFNDVHADIIWPAILFFTALHLIGFIQHQFIKKDRIIARIK